MHVRDAIRRVGPAVWWGGLLAAIAGGCQVVVPADLPSYGCLPGAPDACPRGQYCKGAGCVACEAEDTCGDGFDNDCNGKIDDGANNDRDGDGFTFCGTVVEGRLTAVDCQDDDADVFPGATERCNGKDDNCDGAIDNDACEAGLVCVGAEGRCAPPGCPDVPCTPPLVCSPTSRQCVEPSCPDVPCAPPLVCDTNTKQCIKADTPLGGLCAAGRECASRVCGDTAVLTGLITARAGGSICTQPCCRSEDCPADFICYGAGTGGNYCVSKELIAKPKVGTKTGGETCGNDIECRSGTCGLNGRCTDVCCRDAQCPSGTACARLSFGGRDIFACQPPVGAVAVNDTCTTNADCRTNFCFDYGGFRRCVAPCCASSACGSVSLGGPASTLVCNNALTANDSRMSACNAVKSEPGNLAVGASCTRLAECRSDRCNTNLGGCTDVCCVDADCGNPSWVCRPTALSTGTGQFTALRCVPKD